MLSWCWCKNDVLVIVSWYHLQQMDMFHRVHSSCWHVISSMELLDCHIPIYNCVWMISIITAILLLNTHNNTLWNLRFIHTPTPTYTHTCTKAHIYTHTCPHIRTHPHTHTYVHANMHARADTHTQCIIQGMSVSLTNLVSSSTGSYTSQPSVGYSSLKMYANTC